MQLLLCNAHSQHAKNRHLVTSDYLLKAFGLDAVCVQSYTKHF